MKILEESFIRTPVKVLVEDPWNFNFKTKNGTLTRYFKGPRWGWATCIGDVVVHDKHE